MKQLLDFLDESLPIFFNCDLLSLCLGIGLSSINLGKQSIKTHEDVEDDGWFEAED